MYVEMDEVRCRPS